MNDNEREFFAALNKGDANEVKKFLNLDIKTDCLDDSGMTPLCHAAYRGRAEICSLLLLRGANVNSTGHKSGYTPLMFSVMSGSVETVHLLMAAGADPDKENSTKRTAAQLAAFISQHECANIINSYVRRQDIDYYTIPRGFELKPKLVPRLAAPLHRYLLNTNINLFAIARYLLFTADARVLMDDANFQDVGRVIDCLVERECKSQDLNEIRVMKIHYLGRVLQFACKQNQEDQCFVKNWSDIEDTKQLPNWLKQMAKPSFQDDFAKKTIGSFPYLDLALFRQLVHQIQTSQQSAMFLLLTAIGGRMYDQLSSNEACHTCGSRDAKKQCSKCQSVAYCGNTCQRLDWNIHKRSCELKSEKS